MADDFELDDFHKVCRLFPLPGTVLFPHAVLPLHIFEPRYLQMTEDALAAGDKLVTIVQLRGPSTRQGSGAPPIEDVACLGRILEYRRLPDGRFNFLLMGLKRVRLTRELPTSALYRLAEAEILEDRESEAPGDRLRLELINLFRKVVNSDMASDPDPDLDALLDMELPLGVLTDLVAHAVGIPAEVKQALLAETRVDHRAASLLEVLGHHLALERGSTRERRLFPPPFSMN